MMKKCFALFLAALMLFALPLALAEENHDEPDFEYEDGNPPLAPEFYLPGNPTTGYIWTAESSDEAVAHAVTDFTPAETDAVGAGGMTWVRIDGMSAGTAEITLTYARPWEDETPLFKLVIHVLVQENQDVQIFSTEMESVYL